MKKPNSRSELQRFMGMVNQLRKFSSHIAEVSKPLRELLRLKKSWLWGPAQDGTVFDKVKQELTKPTVLALYDPQANIKICADASAYDLGAVLLQQHSDMH